MYRKWFNLNHFRYVDLLYLCNSTYILCGKTKIRITDGSCLRNPDGPGGWAAVITEKRDGRQTELSGGEASTTNNRMELTAALKALTFAKAGAVIDLYTDSQYLKNGFTKNWLAGWKRKGWVTATGAPVKN